MNFGRSQPHVTEIDVDWVDAPKLEHAKEKNTVQQGDGAWRTQGERDLNEASLSRRGAI